MKPIDWFTIKECAEMYRDYVNNFLTIGAFADYYHLTDEQAQTILRIGDKCHLCGL